MNLKINYLHLIANGKVRETLKNLSFVDLVAKDSPSVQNAFEHTLYYNLLELALFSKIKNLKNSHLKNLNFLFLLILGSEMITIIYVFGVNRSIIIV